MTTILTTSYATLVDAFKQTVSVVSKRPTLPVLRCAVLDTSGDQPHLRGTDLELWSDVTLTPAFASGPSALLPVAEVVKALRGIRGALTPKRAATETVTITSERDTVTVAGFGRTLTIGEQYAAIEDYPRPAADYSAAEPVAVVDSADLTASLTFAATAVGKDDTLPMLTGIRVEGQPDGTITFAATDRYRLTVTECKGSTGEWDALVPSHALPAIKGLTGTVRIDRAGSFGYSSLVFTTDTATLGVRLLDSTFPPFRSLIPTENLHTWTVDREILLADVQAAGVTVEKGDGVRVTFGPDAVTVAGCATHEARSSHPEESFLSAFQPRFLVEGLKAFASAGVQVRATTPVKPYVISGTRPDGAEGLYLIMPVRLPQPASQAA